MAKDKIIEKELVEEELIEKSTQNKEKNKNFLLAACIIIYIIISLIAGYTIYYIYKRPNTYGLTLSLNIISLILAFAILIGAFIIHVKYKNHVSIAKYIYCIAAILILFWNLYYIYKSQKGQNITKTQNTASVVLNSLLIVFSIILIIFSLFYAFKEIKVEKIKKKKVKTDLLKGKEPKYPEQTKTKNEKYNEVIDEIVDNKKYKTKKKTIDDFGTEFKTVDSEIKKNADIEKVNLQPTTNNFSLL